MARLIVSGKVDEIYRGLYKTFSTYGLTAPSNTITQVWTGQREYRLCPPRELIQPELDAPSIEIKPHRSLLNFIRSKISKKDRELWLELAKNAGINPKGAKDGFLKGLF